MHRQSGTGLLMWRQHVSYTAARLSDCTPEATSAADMLHVDLVPF